MAGSEGAVFMAEEARDARRTVPRALIGTISLVIVFYLLTSLAITSGLGSANTSKWGLLGAGVVQELSDKFLVHWFGSLLLAVVAIAGITGALAFSNYVARLIFEWGRDRHLPRVFGRTHPRHRPRLSRLVRRAGEPGVTRQVDDHLRAGLVKGRAHHPDKSCKHPAQNAYTEDKPFLPPNGHRQLVEGRLTVHLFKKWPPWPHAGLVCRDRRLLRP